MNSKSLGTVALKQVWQLQPEAKSSSQPVVATKVLLEHSNTRAFIWIVYGCFHPARTELCGWTETIWPTKPKMCTLSSYRKTLLTPL